MKISKGILIVVVVSFLVGAAATVFAASNEGWPKQQGEVCLNLCVENDCSGEYDPTSIVNMYVTKMGKDHYLVVGRNVEKSGEIVPFIGSAEIVQLPDGPKVRIHATLSLTDPGSFYGQMITGIGDPMTLIGTFEGLHLRVNKADNDSAVYYLSPIRMRPCP
jgi:hypothetical protein